MAKTAAKGIKEPKLSRSKRDTLIAYSFILPNFIGFLLFTLIPLVFAFVLAFMNWDGANEATFVGFKNIARLASDKQFLIALKNTIVYTLGTVPITLVCALFLAILLNEKIFARNFLRSVTFFPYVASLVAVSVVWNFIFNPTQGPVNGFLHSITGLPYSQLPGWGSSKDWAMVTVILFSVWKNMGYYMIIYLAGLQGINPGLYEAASLDGASTWQKFKHITVPQLQPTTFFVTMMMIISSFKVYDIFINLFAGGDNQLGDATRVLVYQIYNTAFRSLDYGYASAQALVLFIIVLGITLIQFRGEKKFG